MELRHNQAAENQIRDELPDGERYDHVDLGDLLRAKRIANRNSVPMPAARPQDQKEDDNESAA
jgi:hypothetical protein